MAGTFVPGLGLYLAGKKRAGAIVLGFAGLLLVVLGWFAIFGKRNLLHLAADPELLALLGPALFLLGLAWVILIVATYRALKPWRISPLAQAGGSAIVALLAVVVMLPLAWTGRLTSVHSNAMGTIFRPDEDIQSETKPTIAAPQSEEDPWGGRTRLNLLLLGSDAGKGRDGSRTDTVIVASIDTQTGATALISLPRNLGMVPFPKDSKLAKAYAPCGSFDPCRKFHSPSEAGEYLLNALYRNVPANNPGLLKSDDPGADALKMAVGEALGLKLDYYVMVNLSGFRELVTALGGITVNINYRVPIGGDTDRGIRPSGYLQPGPNQHLDGYHALWFARGRYGLDDWTRMDRQRCVMKAVIDQSNPAKVLEKYEAIAEVSKKYVKTDIPRSLLSPFVDLSMKVKDAKIESVVFDKSKLKWPGNPDYDYIRSEVKDAIAPIDGADPTANPNPSGEPTTPSGKSTKSPDGKSTVKPKSIEESCAYHPEDR